MGRETETELGVPVSKRSSDHIPVVALDAPLAPGEQVDDYIIESQIGAGAFGTVYRARHAVIDKPAAVKVLGMRHAVDPAIVGRFVEEARAVNRIGHGDIIDIFGFGQLGDGRHYYVMELLGGRTLEEHLEERGPLPPEEVLALLAPVASALDAAHEAGVAHRDVKPANIFLHETEDGVRPKLLDFGVAKLQRDDDAVSQTETGATVGTPSYMSPEQCVGKGVDHRADIYAFGVVAFEMLTGARPFEETSRYHMMAAHLNAPVPDPRKRVSTLSPDTHAALTRIMAKAPSDRPRSVSAALDLLDDAFAGRRVDALVGQRTSRHPRIAAGIAAAMLVGAAVWAVVAAGDPPSASAEPAATSDSSTTATNDATTSPPAAPLADAPSAPTTVTLRLRGLPPGAEVTSDDVDLKALGDGAYQVPRSEQPLVLTVRAAGFEDKTLNLTPSSDSDVFAELKRSSVPEPARPTRKPATRKPGTRKPARAADRAPGATKPTSPERGPDDLEPW